MEVEGAELEVVVVVSGAVLGLEGEVVVVRWKFGRELLELSAASVPPPTCWRYRLSAYRCQGRQFLLESGKRR